MCFISIQICFKIYTDVKLQMDESPISGAIRDVYLQRIKMLEPPSPPKRKKSIVSWFIQNSRMYYNKHLWILK